MRLDESFLFQRSWHFDFKIFNISVQSNQVSLFEFHEKFLDYKDYLHPKIPSSDDKKILSFVFEYIFFHAYIDKQYTTVGFALP